MVKYDKYTNEKFRKKLPKINLRQPYLFQAFNLKLLIFKLL